MVHASLPGDRDVELQEVGWLDRDRLVAGQDAELPRQDPLGQLRQVEGGRVASGASPEARRDGHHGRTFVAECCRAITDCESFRNGARPGGYLRNLNVMSAAPPTALPSGGVPAGTQLSRRHWPGSIEVRGR